MGINTSAYRKKIFGALVYSIIRLVYISARSSVYEKPGCISRANAWRGGIMSPGNLFSYVFNHALYVTLDGTYTRAVGFSVDFIRGGGGGWRALRKAMGLRNSSKLLLKPHKCAKSVREIPEQYCLEVTHIYLFNPLLCVKLNRQILGGWVFSVDVTNGAVIVATSACGLFLFYNFGPLFDL